MILFIEKVPLSVLEDFFPNMSKKFFWVGFVVKDRNIFDDFGGVKDIMCLDVSRWWPLVGGHFQAC